MKRSVLIAALAALTLAGCSKEAPPPPPPPPVKAPEAAPPPPPPAPAADAAKDAAIAADARPHDLVSPGHVFPLRAAGGGVLERRGHTEGAIDLCDLAGVARAAVLCELMNPDGTMARGAQVMSISFCSIGMPTRRATSL